MDKTEAVKIASIYAAALKSKFNYQRVILFGSYAKGTFREESDIDVAVVFNDYDSSIDMQLELMRIRRKIDSRIEPHPFRAVDFEPSNPIVYEILKYGQDISPLVA
jgi:predicted nucleotidyltransferase